MTTRPMTTARRLSKLAVERLDDRTVPSASFDPTFGAGGALQIGSDTAEGPTDMARDAAGNLYLVGLFSISANGGGTTDLDPGPGTYPLTTNGDRDGFVAKYAADGTLLWARSFGGTGFDKATAVAVDPAGNVYVGGQVTGAVDLDPVNSYPDNHDIVPSRASSNSNGFVAQYHPDGSLGWVWQSAATNALSDVADLTTDAAGNVYATGSVPNPFGSYVASAVVGLDGQGATQWRDDILSKNGGFVAHGLAVDGRGDVLLVASMNGSVDVNPGSGSYSLRSNNMSEVVEKLAPGGGFVWARQVAGSDRVEGRAVAVDGAGDVFTAGYYAGKADFDPGKGTSYLTAPTNGGTFISELDPAGNLVWTKGVGAGSNNAYQLTLDAAGGIYLSGTFTGSGDFDPGAGTYTLTSAGQTDAFAMKLGAGGNFAWAARMGGADYDYATGLTVDSATGDVYVAGYFYQTADFGSLSLTSYGSADIFVAKIKQS